MILRYVLAWIPMMLIGILNGVLRQTTYGKLMSELRAHQVSTLIGVLLLGLYIWSLTRLWGLASLQQALLIGVIWFVLTVIFEFGFGHYIVGHSWQHLLRDYNLLAGRVWVFVLIWIAVAPLFFYRF